MKDLQELYYKVWPGKDSLKTSEFLIAENKVRVGKIDGHDAFVTYVYNHFNPFYDENYIVYRVIYDYNIITTDSDYKYDKWNFTLINDMEIESGEHEVRDYIDGEFKAPRMVKVDFFENYKELVYNEVSKPSSIAISKRYKEVSEKLHYMRAKKEKDGVNDFGLEYQILFKEQDLISSKYVDVNLLKIEEIEKELDKLKSMTEEEYLEQRKKEKENWKKLMKDIDFDGIVNRINKKYESNVIKKYNKFIENKKGN